MQNLNKEIFDNLNDKDFKIKKSDETDEIFSLIEIKSINSHTLAEGQSEPFSLLFQSNNDTVFEQGTYRMNNKELSEIDLFLVPIASNKTGVQYEAVFT
jgi:hypothetical protein